MTFIFVALHIILHITITQALQTLKIHAITFGDEYPTTRAQQTAIQDINNDLTMLPNYKLEFVLHDSQRNKDTALDYAITIDDELSLCNSNASSIIVLGCPWSSHSALTSRVFNIKHKIQISSSSTSPKFSKSDYPSFFRTAPSDKLQAKALIYLCEIFEWKRIGVFHINDEYGEGLNDEIINAANGTIEVTSKSFIHGDVFSAQEVATFITKNELYITIIIAHEGDTTTLFNALYNANKIGYPYLYIGVEGWLGENEIVESHILEWVKGTVGTMVGSLSMLTKEQYVEFNPADKNATIYEYTKANRDRLQIALNGYYAFMDYAYDSAYAAAVALDIFDKEFSLTECTIDSKTAQSKLIEILHNITIEGPCTGPFRFDLNGDRSDDNSMFLFGNVRHNGSIQTFGAVSNGQGYVDTNEIIWPEDFPHAPWSEPRTVSNKTGVHDVPAIVFSIIAVICVFIVWLVVVWKKITNAQTNIVSMAISISLCCINIVIYAAINYTPFYHHQYQAMFTFGCHFEIWLLCIAFTLLCLPLFKNEYKLNYPSWKHVAANNISDWLNEDTKIPVVAVIIDCTIFGLFEATHWVIYSLLDVQLLYFKFNIEGTSPDKNDILSNIQTEYPVCQSHQFANAFIGMVVFWKFAEIFVAAKIAPYRAFICICCIVIASIWNILHMLLVSNAISKNTEYIIIANSFIIFMGCLIASKLHQTKEAASSSANSTSSDHQYVNLSDNEFSHKRSTNVLY